MIAPQSKYKPEYCELVIEHMKEGLSKEAFAAKVGKHKQTIYNWIDAHEDFAEAVKIGEAHSRLFWERLGINGARGAIDGFNAAVWIFNMKNRFHEEWKDRHEHTGADGQALVVQIVKHSDADKD